MSSRHAAHHQSPPQQQQHYSPQQQQQQHYSPQQQQQRHWQPDAGLRSSFDEQLPSAYSDVRANPIPEGRDVAALIDPDERQIPTLVKQSGAAAGGRRRVGGGADSRWRHRNGTGGHQRSQCQRRQRAAAGDGAPPPSRSFCDFVLQVLDERSVKCLFSKVWGFRDEGISSVVNALPNLGVDKQHVFRSIVSVIKRGLSDKIPQVYVFFNLIHSHNAHSAFVSGTIPRCACCRCSATRLPRRRGRATSWRLRSRWLGPLSRSCRSVRPVFMHVYLPALFAFAAVWAAG